MQKNFQLSACSNLNTKTNDINNNKSNISIENLAIQIYNIELNFKLFNPFLNLNRFLSLQIFGSIK